MVESGGEGPAFPVLYFDGEREMEIGDVRINPAMGYKPFQLILSEKIGISPNQMSIYLVNQKRNHRPPFSEDRRRIPITGKVNFYSICRQKECYFLVIHKRSRKSKNRREKMAVNSIDFSPAPVHPATANLILLRRNQPTSFYGQIARHPKVYDLNSRLRRMSVERENNHMEMPEGDLNLLNFGPDHAFDPNLNVELLPATDDGYRDNSTWLVMKKKETKAFCEECWNAKKNGGMMSFHPCVNDAVITRFNTRLGPINRPNRSLP